MNAEEPPWSTFQVKFRREYICLKCSEIYTENRPRCQKCGGPVCVRIVKTRV